MSPLTSASQNLQLVEATNSKVAKKLPKTLKARHLAPETRATIVRLFQARLSYADVALEMNVPGLSGRTVSEVLHAEVFRRPPSSDGRSLGLRTMRSAA